MAKLLKFLIIILPVGEIVSLLVVGDEIGVVPTLLLLAAGAVFGTVVIRWLGAAAFRDFQIAVERGQPPLQALWTGAATLGAGVLFIIPGFLSDVLAILLLLHAGWTHLRRPRTPSADSMPPGSAGMPGVAKIVDAEFVIVEKEQNADPRNPNREAP